MTAAVNGFETGSTGATITTGNSGGFGTFTSLYNNAFDTVTVGAGAAMVFTSTLAAHGTLAALVNTGTGAVTSTVQWSTTIGTVPQAWFRFYSYFPSNLTQPVKVFNTEGVSGDAASILLSTAGAIQLCDANAVPQATFTSTVPTGQWFRMEGSVTGSASSGTISASLYTVMDSPYPTETQTAGSINTQGSLTSFWFGQGTAVASTPTFYLDDVGVSAVRNLGPAGQASV